MLEYQEVDVTTKHEILYMEHQAGVLHIIPKFVSLIKGRHNEYRYLLQQMIVKVPFDLKV